MEVLIKIISLGRSARNKANIKNRQPLSKVSLFCDDEIKLIIEQNKNQIIEELNLKNVTFVNNENELIEYDLKPNYKILGQRFGEKMSEIISEINKNKNNFLPLVVSKEIIHLKSENLEGITLNSDDFILCENGVGNYTIATANEFIVGIDTEISQELKNEGIVRDLVRYVQNLRKDSGLNVEDRIIFGIETDQVILDALLNNREYFLNEVLGTEIKINSINKMDFKSMISINGKTLHIAISHLKGD